MDNEQHISNDVRKAVVIFQVVIYILFITPFMVYNMRRLSQISSSLLIQKRHPQILWLQGIFIITWFALIAPIMALDFSQLSDFSAPTQEIISRLNCTLYPFVSFGFTLTNAWRFYLIFFDLKYNSSQKNSEWKYYLDCKHSERVFWLVYRKSYGSYFATKSIFIKIYCINVFIMIITYQIAIGTPYIMIGHLVSIFSHSLCIVVVLLVWWKLPAYKDDLYVKKEVKLVSIILCASQAAADISMAFCFILRYNVIFMSVCMSGSFLIWSVALVSFWWIPKRVAQIELEHQLLRTSLSMSSSSSSELASISEFKSGMTNKERDKRKFNNTLRRLSQDSTKRTRGHDFYTIASNPSTFKLLMQHLGKEFSLENMLCFIEIVQYKFALKLRVDRIDSELIDKQETFDKNLPLSGVIQMSAINQNGFDALSAYKKRDANSTKMLIEHAKRVCVELYKKYIKVGSELEINIGYDDRIALTMLIDDETWFMDSESQINELFTVFDDAATEVLKLLMSSFFRFQHKDEWKIACNVLDEINN